MSKITTCMILTLFLVLFSMVVSADMLSIKEITVEVNGDREGSADEHGGSIDIPPDSTLKLKIEIENLYDSDVEGGEIEDIEIEATIEEIDDGDNLEEHADDFDLRAGRDKTVTIEFDIPLRLETDEVYKLLIIVDGEDKNNTEHHAEVEFDVEVDKENHELRFLRKELSPSSVSCDGLARLVLSIINTGEEDEDVEFTVDSSALKYNEVRTFDMSEDIDDDDNEYDFSDTIDTEGITPGTYSIVVRALYRDNREVLEDVLYLKVEACAADVPEPEPEPALEPEPEPEPEPVVITQPIQPTQSSSPYVRPVTTAVATPRTTYTKNSAFTDGWMVPVLLAVLLVLLISVVVLVIVLIKKRN